MCLSPAIPLTRWGMALNKNMPPKKAVKLFICFTPFLDLISTIGIIHFLFFDKCLIVL
jgi:hypothetical protein